MQPQQESNLDAPDLDANWFALPKIMAVTVLVLAIWSARAAADSTFYVATNGNDSWNGLSSSYTGGNNGPFASLGRAQLAVQSLAGTQAVTVEVRAGTYYLALAATSPGTLIFGSADSGTSAYPIVWEAFPGEVPILSGGVPLGTGGLNLTWQNVGGNLWQVQLPANIVSNVPLQPFEYLYYNGRRRLRSRLESPLGVGYYMSQGSCISTQTGKTVATSYCNLGTMLRVHNSIPPRNTGCPSSSDGGSESKCLDRFEYDPNETTITNWINLNGTVISSQPCQPSNSYPAGDVALTLFDSWTVDAMRINCVDTTDHIIYLIGATQGDSGDFMHYSYYGPTPGHRYVVENTLDAFRAAFKTGQTGLWFLDRSTSPPVLNYIANADENPNTDAVVIPQLPFPSQLTNQFPQQTNGQEANDFIGGSLIWATNLSYVTFSGITFEVDNFVPSYVAGFNNDINGELSAPQAIDCESCQNVTFDHVTVRHTSMSGLLIASTSGNSGTPAASDTIENSTFEDIGDSGVRLGHYPAATDLAADVVNNITVQNNLVDGYSRLIPSGEGIAQGNGNTILLSHNDITDGYHAGISICQLYCAGAETGANGTAVVSQFNHLWNLMQGLTSDGGSLYYDVGGPNGSGTGDKMYHNLIHDTTDSGIIDMVHNKPVGPGTAFGGEGLYADSLSAGIDARYNVVYHMSGHAIHMTKGQAQGQPPNFFSNNILSLVRHGMFGIVLPWLVTGCYQATVPRAQLYDNIFNFDRAVDPKHPTAFSVVDGCTNSCGLPFNKFVDFERNAYWRVQGGFASDPRAFHVLKHPPADGTCPGSARSTAFDWLTFDQPRHGSHTWRYGKPPATPVSMDEDLGSTATWNPKFGTTGKPSDYLLSRQPPIKGFDIKQTNATIHGAGRTSGFPPDVVPATFPTYSFTTF
jgi:hypothetical protein